MTTLEKRLFSDGPKRILSLDGGGIRGAITLGFLVELEQHLRDRHDNQKLLLRDYFDLIGGTSTGSIIAASLAIGMDVKSVRDAYLEMGGHIFEKPASWWQVLRWFRQNLKYRNKPAEIEGTLQRFYGDRLLGDESIETGLCIVTKRVDKASIWPLTNNPRAKYFEDNKVMPLWMLVRASSAAPTFFPPIMMDYGNGKGVFIDGGVSMHNNPSMQLFLMATLEGYAYKWKTGADNILIVSIGTGSSKFMPGNQDIKKLGKENALFWGKTVPNLFIRDGSDYAEILMQSLSTSPTARRIDREIGNLSGDQLGGTEMLSYLRYNAVVDDSVVQAQADFTRQDSKKYPPISSVKDMMKMDNGELVYHLSKIGETAAKKSLTKSHFEAHFPSNFDLPKG